MDLRACLLVLNHFHFASKWDYSYQAFGQAQSNFEGCVVYVSSCELMGCIREPLHNCAVA